MPEDIFFYYYYLYRQVISLLTYYKSLKIFNNPTYRLQIGHHIEDDKVVKEVEECRNRPLQVAEKRGTR